MLGLVRLRVAKARKNRKHIWKHPTGCKTRHLKLRFVERLGIGNTECNRRTKYAGRCNNSLRLLYGELNIKLKCVVDFPQQVLLQLAPTRKASSVLADDSLSLRVIEKSNLRLSLDVVSEAARITVRFLALVDPAASACRHKNVWGRPGLRVYQSH